MLHTSVYAHFNQWNHSINSIHAVFKPIAIAIYGEHPFILVNAYIIIFNGCTFRHIDMDHNSNTRSTLLSLFFYYYNCLIESKTLHPLFLKLLTHIDKLLSRKIRVPVLLHTSLATSVGILLAKEILF